MPTVAKVADSAIIVNGVYEFPNIIGKSKSDRETFYKIKVLGYRKNKLVDIIDKTDNLDYCEIFVESGQVGGKTRNVKPTRVSAGKNIGRSNETTVLTQSLNDAQSKYNKHNKIIAPNTANSFYPPMLAQVYQSGKFSLTHFENKVFVQPKFNGVRCLSKWENDETLILQSRTGKQFYHLHIIEQLKLIQPKDMILDGELYIHNISLQDISGWARSEKQTLNTLKLNYFIYDCFISTQPDMIFEKRWNLVTQLIANKQNNIMFTETMQVADSVEINDYYLKQIKNNYEGAMLRLNVAYQPGYNNYHSPVLLKIKPTLDAEYVVVNVWPALKGAAAGCLMITAQNESGRTFDVTPSLPLEKRKLMLIDNSASNLIGKKITIYFDELSKDNVPLRARTKCEIYEPL